MHRRSFSRLSVTILLTMMAGLLSALTGILGNLATNSIPPILAPYLRFAWPAFGVVVVLGIGVAVWQVRREVLTSSSHADEQEIVRSLAASTSAQEQDMNSNYHSCVLSYSSEDQTFAAKLYEDLRQQGVSCWFATHDLKIGDKLRTQIYEAIQTKDKLLLILSEDAIKSDWVEREVELSFEEERQQERLILFPIRLDNAVMHTSAAWAGDIRRTRFIGDFSRWQDEQWYKRALQRLLSDLHT